MIARYSFLLLAWYSGLVANIMCAQKIILISNLIWISWTRKIIIRYFKRTRSLNKNMIKGKLSLVISKVLLKEERIWIGRKERERERSNTHYFRKRQISMLIKRRIMHLQSSTKNNSHETSLRSISFSFSLFRHRDFSAAPHYWRRSKRDGSPVSCLFSLIPIFLKSQPSELVAAHLNAPSANGI